MGIGIFVDGGDYETLGNWTSNDNNSIKIRGQGEEEEFMMVSDLRRGPWTVEEDMLLVNYISEHGEGRWNSLAYSAGLKRTGKSCRLRWLNYLRPNVRRGNITPEEQLLILQLHSRWGNKWSKIAQYLPGRTDNEIKNYWRTRVQKHAKQLKCDVNSQQFKDAMQHIWIPRLLETIRAKSGTKTAAVTAVVTAVVTSDSTKYETNEGELSAADELKPCPESSVEECSTGTISQLSSPPPVSSDLTAGDCFAGDWVNWADEIPAGGCGSVFDELSQGLVDFDDVFSGRGEISDVEFWNSMDDFWS